MTERWSFVVAHRAADYVMEAHDSPTADGRVISFPGVRPEEDQDPKEAALSRVQSILGGEALCLSLRDLSGPKVESYNRKYGLFFKILLPGDVEIAAVSATKGAQNIIKTYDEVVAAASNLELLELSRIYVERNIK